MLATTLTAALVAALSVAYHHWAAPRWRERDIHTGRTPLTALSALSIPLAAILAWITQPALNTLPNHSAIAAAAGLGAWTALAVLATGTDLASTKVPRDACLFASTVGLAAVISTLTLPFIVLALISLCVLAGIAIFARFLIGGLGFSDVRILAAAGLTLGWWIPTPYLMYGLILASIAQLLARLLLPKRWLARIAEKPDPEASNPESPESDRPRKQPLPFAPAIILGITGFTVYAGINADTTCALWSGLC